MNRTELLAAICVAALLVHFVPSSAIVVWCVSVVGAIGWVGMTSLRMYRHYEKNTINATMVAADAEEYRHYEVELNGLRDDASLSPEEYESGLAALQTKYRSMLERRFGPH